MADVRNFLSGALGALFVVSCAACSSGSDDDGVAGPSSALGGSTAPNPTAGTGNQNTGSSGTTGGGGTTAPRGGAGTPTAGAVAAGGTGASAGGTSGGTAGTDSTQPASGDSWRMMGYDETNTYFNPAEKTISVANAGMLVEKWRKPVSGFPPGSPVIADGKVFVMATAGTYAFDLNTGDQLWAKMEINGTASLAYDNGFVYAHAGPTAELYKLNAADGMVVWGPKKTYALMNCDGTSSPVVAGGKVIVGHSCGVREVGSGQNLSRGGVEAFDAETGNAAWTYWTVPMAGPEDGAMVWSTVAIDAAGGVVYAATGNNYTTAGPGSDSIHAINIADGMRKWAKQVRANDVWSTAMLAGDDTDFGANPILATVGGKKVVAAGDKGSAFWQLDRETGNIDWSRADMSGSHTAQNGGILMNGAFDGTHFYAVSNDPGAAQAVLHKLDPANMGADVWKKMYPKLTWGAPSLANGVLFVPINDDLYVLNAADGAMLTMLNAGGSIAAGAAAVAQGHVVVGSGLNYIFGGLDAINNNQVICYGLP